MGNVEKILKLNVSNKKLIFDLGFYNGDTSEHYLKKGYRVVGVECNNELLYNVIRDFDKYIANGSLIICNKCVSTKDNDMVSFYISSYPEWSSCNKHIAERIEKSTKIDVETITLAKLIEIYGCPSYCKIDIEGNDIIALQSILNTEYRPKVISCESQCYGKGETGSGLEVLDKLHELGYTKYMLVNQRTDSLFRFELNTEYPWISYNEIKEQLLNIEDNSDTYGRWADIYATY